MLTTTFSLTKALMLVWNSTKLWFPTNLSYFHSKAFDYELDTETVNDKIIFETIMLYYKIIVLICFSIVFI